MPGTAEVWSDALARDLAPWGWLALLVGPPLVAWLRRRRAARELGADGELSQGGGAGSDGGGGPARPGRLGRLEREVHGVLASHVPDAPARDGAWVARALRAGGGGSARGALRAAGDSCAARAAAQPRVPAQWYDLGATLYRAGADGKALAAWARAGRLAPRDRLMVRAHELLPTPDAASDPLLAAGVATPAEWEIGRAHV